jgi:hypothetical protein
VPRVDYSNLTIIAAPEINKGRYAANFYKFSKNRVNYASFAKGLITKYLPPGQRVFVACRKDLIPEFTDWRPSDDRYRQAAYRRGGADGYLINVEGRHCAVTNYGDGVGSNEYKEASACLLLDNFWIPVREAIAQGLGLQRKPADGQGLSKSLNTSHPAVRAMLEGTALRQILQMLGRSAVRNVDPVGRCGQAVAIYSGDIGLLRRNLLAMFPGAKLVDKTGWVPTTYMERMLALLEDVPADTLEVAAAALTEGLGKPWKDIAKHAPSKEDLALIGWEYLRGKKGQPAMFRRSVLPAFPDLPAELASPAGWAM